MKTKLTVNVFRSNTLLLSLLSVCCLVFFSISSCKKSKGTGGPPVDNTAPVVGSISPLKGPGLTEVTIEGSNFSTTLSENKVTINGKEALVIEATATKLVVLVPMGAGTGPIKVQVGTKTGTGPNFEYEWVLVVNTLAGDQEGFADGTGRDAEFSNPSGMVLASDGSLYVTDGPNHRIRKVTAEGVVTTFAGGREDYVDGPLSTARFTSPTSIVASSGGVFYVGEQGGIRKIAADGTVSTFAGQGPDNTGFADGQGTAAKFSAVTSMVIDAQQNIYALDMQDSYAIQGVRIRKITPAGMVSTLAGGPAVNSGVGNGTGYFDYRDGPGATAKFSTGVGGLAIDPQGNLFLGDQANNCIRKITSDGTVSTYAGVKGEGSIINGQLGSAARFRMPISIVIDSKSNMYVGDYGVLRKITAAGIVSSYAGNGAWAHLDGPAMIAGIGGASALTFSADESILYFCGTVDSRRTIRRIMLQ